LYARDLGRAAAAVEQLRELLDEDPTCDEAATTLVDLLEASGNRDELTELLEKRLDAAKDRGDAAGVAALALRLGGLIEKDEPRRARQMFALGLDWESANIDLLRASLRVVPAEDAADRSELLDRLLAVSGGAEAESLALELASLRMEQWDSDGAERALEAGLRGQPASPLLRERLMSAYADRGDSAKLAALHELTAPAMPEAERRAAHLEAARLYTELGERTAVVRVLRAAHLGHPTDGEVLQSYLDALVRPTTSPRPAPSWTPSRRRSRTRPTRRAGSSREPASPSATTAIKTPSTPRKARTPSIARTRTPSQRSSRSRRRR